MTLWQCSYCDSQNRDDALRCTQCGAGREQIDRAHRVAITDGPITWGGVKMHWNVTGNVPEYPAIVRAGVEEGLRACGYWPPSPRILVMFDDSCLALRRNALALMGLGD